SLFVHYRAIIKLLLSHYRAIVELYRAILKISLPL
ncbi:unnamed protein product, partial [marine sediment metagenome]